MQRETALPRSTKPRAVYRRKADAGLEMTRADIERFLEEWKAKGCVPGTLERYRHSLNRLYDFLPEDKRIRRGTLEAWRAELIGSGYAANTVNLVFSVCNTWLDFMNRREYQQADALQEEKPQPELTRGEYLRLLQTAREQGKERTYLLVKVFATTGIHVQEL